ncbi:extracellular calcium-sensing receptor-like [Lepisosteus oculatus]|uniref:extracellular calcium-sensing receptor-like n=1 Tax=Lepisosteus oculatus TaxID=7918 RepID=UPI0035F5057E
MLSFHKRLQNVRYTFNTFSEAFKCDGLNFREIQIAQTLIFAIDEINKDSSLLPNVTLGYKIFDTCGSTPLAIKAALALVNSQDETLSEEPCTKPATVPAIIGLSSSSSTIGIATTVGPFHIPVISHLATCACLSNRKRFPSFFRTVPSDYYQSRALAQLVKHFGWTWVGAIRSDDDYGNSGMATFVEAALQEGICVEYSEAFYKTDPREKIHRILKTIKNSTSKVILAFLPQVEMSMLLQEMLQQNVTGVQWIGSESWITSRNLATNEGSKLLGGAIGFAFRKATIPDLEEFLLSLSPSAVPNSQFMKEFWETVFSCSLNTYNKSIVTKTCTGFEHLSQVNNEYTDVSDMRIPNNVYKAVYAIAHSLHELLTCSDTICPNKISMEPWQVLNQMKSINFTTRTGEAVYFDEKGDSAARYDLVNWQINDNGVAEFITVGYYDTHLPDDHRFKMNNIKIVWRDGQDKVPQSVCSKTCFPGTRKAIKKGKPICCFDCVQCAQGEISNQTDSLDCDKCPLEYWSNENRDQCILKDTEFLSYEETLGILLSIFSMLGACFTLAVAIILFHYKHTPIVKANNSEKKKKKLTYCKKSSSSWWLRLHA